MTFPCPTPQRVAHPNQETAHRQRINDRIRDNATHHPYKCRCGHWHLTPNLDQELPTYQQAAPEDVARLRHLNHAAFTSLVDADVKKTAPIPDRLALRHPDLNTRWRWSLKVLQRTVRDQLAQDGPDDWRTKARLYDTVLTDRLAECKALRTHTTQEHAA